MNYELAKELKDAGFDQHDYQIPQEAEHRDAWMSDAGYHLVMDEPELVKGMGSENCKKRRAQIYALHYLESDEGRANTVYIPTLSELIEACVPNFFKLGLEPNGKWSAFNVKNASIYGEDGSTPEEAVAKLYLQLNLKSQP